jgi:DNA-binding beta-propeller fold protein YncE
VLHSISLGEHLGTFDLAVNQETNEIFAGISNRYPGQVAIIDGNNDTLTKKIEVGDKPIGIGVNTVTGKVYVANSNDETVSVIAKTTECRT